MNKFLSSLCASAFAMTFPTVAGIPQASAVPLVVPAAPSAPANVHNVQGEWWMGSRGGGMGGGGWGGPAWRGGGGWHGGGGWNRGWQGRPGWNGGWNRGWRGGNNWAYYNGHRGYRYYRPGYRYYNNFWFPGAAFATGAIIGGIIANSQPAYRYGGGSAHERWCYNRYRSYRAWDNTFQPYNGPRQQCYSPY